MILNTNQMKCGGCGCEDFKIYTNKRKGDEDCIFISCNQCSSVNTITIEQKPRLNFDWEGLGGLVVFDYERD